MILKSKNPSSGQQLYDLIFDALDESQRGRGADSGGATAFEIAIRIGLKNPGLDHFYIEKALEELTKSGVVRKIVPSPVFLKK